MHFAVGRLFYEENREMFLVPGESSPHRIIRNIEVRLHFEFNSTASPPTFPRSDSCKILIMNEIFTSANMRKRRYARGSQVVKVTDSWLMCHEIEPSNTEDPPCREAMHVKFVESSNVLVWCGS
ncbi:hypothetical protein TNCV_3201111 [Trichonephila clavipes]|nr:hypothetical protein TNCV_3201111 [Trichonephila clavipes]